MNAGPKIERGQLAGQAARRYPAPGKNMSVLEPPVAASAQGKNMCVLELWYNSTSRAHGPVL